MISDFIRRRLQQLNISQADLATRLNLRGFSTTRASIGHWVSDRNNPPLDDKTFIDALASALEISPSQMLIEMGILKRDEARSEEAQFAASIVDRLPNDAKELAIEYLKMLERRYVYER